MTSSKPHNGEFVVSADLAAVAERQGVPLYAGDRVRFEIIEGGKTEHDGPSSKGPWPPAWFDSITTDRSDLSTTFRQIMRDEIAEQ